MKRRLLPLLLTVVLVVALAVPMFAITAAAEETTISFASTVHRVSQDENKQVWSNAGVTLTNNKAASTNAIIDSSNPVKFYANSALEITAPGNITKIVFDCNTGTYASNLSKSIGSAIGTATVSSDKVTVIPTEPANTFTIAKLSAQVRMDSLTVTYTNAPACTHPDFTPIETVKPTKASKGYTVYKCVNCDYTENRDETNALPSTITFISPDGTTMSDEWILEGTLPDTTCTVDGYTFEGWAKVEVKEDTLSKPVFYSEGDTVNVTDDTTFYALYSYTEEPASAGFEKADLATIGANDVVVIVANNGATMYALPNNGGASTPTAETGFNLADPDKNLKWNVVNNNGSYTFYPNGDTSKWLYCTDSNSGVRVGGTEKKGTEFTLKNGYLYCTDRGRYVGVYTTEPDWRCYTSINDNIKGQTFDFYVKKSNVTYYTTSPVMPEPEIPEIECTEPTFDAASMLVSNDLTLNYLVKVPAGFESALTVKFTMNKKTVEVIGDLQDDGRYLFAFKVGPQYVFDNIKAVLYVNGEDVGISVDEYSVAKYVQNVTAKTDDEALKTLLASVLVYGEQAKNYVDKTPGEALDAGDAPETEAEVNRPDDNNLANCFVGAGVKFECKNSLYVIIRANSAFTLKIGDIEVNSDDDEIIDAHNGEYFFYLPVAIQDFDVLYNFEMYVGGVKTHSITYSVDTYLAQMWNWDKDLVTANLVKATYMLGAAASAYEAVEDKFN